MKARGSCSAPATTTAAAAAVVLMGATLLVVLVVSSPHGGGSGGAVSVAAEGRRRPVPALGGAMDGYTDRSREQGRPVLEWDVTRFFRVVLPTSRKLLHQQKQQQRQQQQVHPDGQRQAGADDATAGHAPSSAAHHPPPPALKTTPPPPPAPSVGNDPDVSNPTRIGFSCSKDDVAVYQSPTDKLPSGIPTYTVRVMNVCASGCAVSGVHVSCGWYSSAKLVSPRLFRRLRFDDCLVNDGQPIPPGGGLVFTYANTYRYPLVVTALSCEHNT